MTVESIKQMYAQELLDPVGGRLADYSHRWEKLGARPYMVSKLRYGIHLNWKGPLITSGYRDSLRDELLSEAVSQMLQKQVIAPVHNFAYLPGFYSRLFLVPKPNHKWRPVIDLSALNRYLVVPHFQMETAKTIRQSLQQGEWTTSLDLSDAYYHLKIRPRFRKYFRFHFRGVVYQYLAMPFGLATAPSEFTEVGKEFKALATSLNLRLNQYLDDWLNRALSKLIGEEKIVKLLNLVIFLGWLPNFEKSQLVPTEKFQFLGEFYNLQLAMVYPTEQRLIKIANKLNEFQNAQAMSARQWMSLTGLLQATTSQVHLSRLRLRPLQWGLKKGWKWTQNLDKQVPINQWVRSSLQWWSQEHILRRGVPLHPPQPQISLYTDASLQGWGAHCEGSELQGQWTDQEKELHINFLELKTVLLALQGFVQHLRHMVVLVLCDNSTAVAYVAKQGGTRVAANMTLSWEILSFAEMNHITLQIRHIPGDLNVLADRLSRKGQLLQGEWSLNPQVFANLCKLLGTPTLDLFATSLNAKLPLYISPIPDVNAVSVNA